MPAEIPVTMPVTASTLPMAGLLLVQVPPDKMSDKPVVRPAQTFKVPDIGFGTWLTVTVIVARQPDGRE